MDGRVPIACSLAGDDARRRAQKWTALVGQSLKVERSDQHLTIHFAANHILLTELTKLVVAERQCCGFVAWELDDRGNEMVLTVRGDALGVTAMAETFRLDN